MAIFDAFYLLFKADTSDANKKLSSLDKSITGLDKKLRSTTTAIARSIAAVASVAAVLAAANYADQLGEMSEALEVDIEKLSMWSDAVKLSGGTAEGFQETVKTMTAALQENAVKGKSRIAPFYKALGISLRDAKGHARGFLDILPELAGKFEGLSKQQAFGLGQKLGLDRGTIMLLQKGRKEVDAVLKRQKELGVVTKEDAAIAAKFNDELDDTAHVFRSVGIQVGSLVLPVLSKLLRGVQKVFTFIKDNKDLTKGAIIGIATALTAFLIPAVIRLVSASAPLTLLASLIGTIIALFALAYDDITAYLDGQESLIGEIFSKYPVIKSIVMGIINAVKILIQIFMTFAQFAKDSFFYPMRAAENLKKGIYGIIKSVKELFPAVKPQIEMITSAFAKATDFIKGLWESLTAVIKTTLDVVLAVINAISKAKSAVVSKFTAPVPISASNPLSARAVNGGFASVSSPTTVGGNRSISVNTGAIEINTQATDAPAIASDFTSELTRQLRQAINTMDDGVAI